MRANENRKRFEAIYNYNIHPVQKTTIDEMVEEAHNQHISYGRLQTMETCELLRRMRGGNNEK